MSIQLERYIRQTIEEGKAKGLSSKPAAGKIKAAAKTAKEIAGDMYGVGWRSGAVNAVAGAAIGAATGQSAQYAAGMGAAGAALGAGMALAAGVKNARSTYNRIRTYGEDSQNDGKAISEGSHYHSIFVKNDQGKWVHHFDADDAEDAREEASSLRNGGEKPKILKIKKSEAPRNWTKIDIHDFVEKRLAKKTPVKESVEFSDSELAYFDTLLEDEQIAELSDRTLKSYSRKVLRDVDNRVDNLTKTSPKKDRVKIKSRMQGLDTAATKLNDRKMNKEETQLDELSNKILGNYVGRALDDVNNKARATMVGGTPAQKKAFYKKMDAKADQRMFNVGIAVDKMKRNDAKLNKEEYGDLFSDEELARLEATLEDHSDK